MSSKKIVILTDLHFGRSNNAEHFDKIARRFIDWFKERECGEGSVLVINGDTFDNRLAMSLKTKRLFDYFADAIYDQFYDVFINLGNHDMVGRTTVNETMFDVLSEDFEASNYFREGGIKIARGSRLYEVDGKVIQLIPYGCKFDYDEDAEFIFTHDNFPPKAHCPVLNGHIHDPDEYVEGKPYNLGSAYQLSAAQGDDVLGYHVIHEDGTIEKIVYDADRLFLNVRLVNSRIDGMQPIKWLTQNRELIKQTHELKIIVDHETSKSALEKFYAVLSTINSNYNLVDSITAATETKISTNRNVLDTLISLLPEKESYKAKAKQIFAEASQ